jgi:hypothetical protein
MITHDIYILPIPKNIRAFSVNGVPWPLDDWLISQNKMTIDEAINLIKINEWMKRWE